MASVEKITRRAAGMLIEPLNLTLFYLILFRALGPDLWRLEDCEARRRHADFGSRVVNSFCA